MDREAQGARFLTYRLDILLESYHAAKTLACVPALAAVACTRDSVGIYLRREKKTKRKCFAAKRTKKTKHAVRGVARLLSLHSTSTTSRERKTEGGGGILQHL